MQIDNIDELADRFYSRDESVRLIGRQHTRVEIAAHIRDTVDRLAGIVERMTPAQLPYRPPGAPTGPDESGDEAHFDTSQIVTHLAFGTAFHWWNITRCLKHDRPPFPKPPEGVTMTGNKRTGMGTGGWSGVPAGELVDLLRGTMDGFLSYVASLPDELDTEATTSFSFFRNMTAHDWLFLVAVHCQMHLKQLEDMQAQPDYPRDWAGKNPS